MDWSCCLLRSPRLWSSDISWDRSDSILLSTSASFPSSLPAAIRARINEDRSSPRAWTPGQTPRCRALPRASQVFPMTAAATATAAGGCSCAFRPKVTYSSTQLLPPLLNGVAAPSTRWWRIRPASPANTTGRCTRAFRSKVPRRRRRRRPRRASRLCRRRRGGRPSTRRPTRVSRAPCRPCSRRRGTPATRAPARHCCCRPAAAGPRYTIPSSVRVRGPK